MKLFGPISMVLWRVFLEFTGAAWQLIWDSPTVQRLYSPKWNEYEYGKQIKTWVNPYLCVSPLNRVIQSSKSLSNMSMNLDPKYVVQYHVYFVFGKGSFWPTGFTRVFHADHRRPLTNFSSLSRRATTMTMHCEGSFFRCRNGGKETGRGRAVQGFGCVLLGY